MKNKDEHVSCEHHDPSTNRIKKRFLKNIDYLLWGSITLIVISYVIQYAANSITLPAWLLQFTSDVVALTNRMSWGILLGIIFVGILDKVPQSLIIHILGKQRTLRIDFPIWISHPELDYYSPAESQWKFRWIFSFQ